MLTLTLPEASVWTLPRSPAWRLVSSGAPCSLERGLKWPPALAQPPELSPNSAVSGGAFKDGLRTVDVETALGVGVEVLDLPLARRGGVVV